MKKRRCRVYTDIRPGPTTTTEPRSRETTAGMVRAWKNTLRYPRALLIRGKSWYMVWPSNSIIHAIMEDNDE